MPLPEGFTVGGVAVSPKAPPPAVLKVIAALDKLPNRSLESTAALCTLTGLTDSRWVQHQILSEYRYKVDGKLFWGSRSTIMELKKSLKDSE